MVSNTKFLALISLVSSIAHTTLLSYRDYILQVMQQDFMMIEKKQCEIESFNILRSKCFSHEIRNTKHAITNGYFLTKHTDTAPSGLWKRFFCTVHLCTCVKSCLSNSMLHKHYMAIVINLTILPSVKCVFCFFTNVQCNLNSPYRIVQYNDDNINHVLISFEYVLCARLNISFEGAIVG